jgi:hypothetical protein
MLYYERVREIDSTGNILSRYTVHHVASPPSTSILDIVDSGRIVVVVVVVVVVIGMESPGSNMRFVISHMLNVTGMVMMLREGKDDKKE